MARTAPTATWICSPTCRPAGLSLFGLGRVEAELEAILGSRADLIPAADLKPGVRARVQRDLVAL